jgi:N-acetylmuramoyl-L-alanine amidase
VALTRQRGHRALRGREARLCRWLALCLFVLNGTAPALAASSSRVTQVERYVTPDAARIVFYLSGPVEFRTGAEAAPQSATHQLSLELLGAEYAGASVLEQPGLVQRLHIGSVKSGVEIGFDLEGPVQSAVFFFPEPFRIVVDLSRLNPRARETGREVRRVALDPGHGGSETGAIGPEGVREKDVVLDIAHRAAPLLAHELGVSTLLTRDDDEHVPLEERVAKANAFGADLFLSIHCNADPSGTARGAISFVLDGSHDHRSVRLLERENAAPISGSGDFAGFLRQFDHATTAARSVTFARLLQRATLASLVGYPGAVDGGVRGAGFFVLAGARMPAVLFETSFVSNTLEERRLNTPRYRQKLADAIVNAVRAYKSGY